MAQTIECMIASYLELYEEGEAEHINGVWPVLSDKQLKQNPQSNHPLWPFDYLFIHFNIIY